MAVPRRFTSVTGPYPQLSQAIAKSHRSLATGSSSHPHTSTRKQLRFSELGSIPSSLTTPAAQTASLLRHSNQGTSNVTCQNLSSSTNTLHVRSFHASSLRAAAPDPPEEASIVGGAGDALAVEEEEAWLLSDGMKPLSVGDLVEVRRQGRTYLGILCVVPPKSDPKAAFAPCKTVLPGGLVIEHRSSEVSFHIPGWGFSAIVDVPLTSKEIATAYTETKPTATRKSNPITPPSSETSLFISPQGSSLLSSQLGRSPAHILAHLNRFIRAMEQYSSEHRDKFRRAYDHFLSLANPDTAEASEKTPKKSGKQKGKPQRTASSLHNEVAQKERKPTFTVEELAQWVFQPAPPRSFAAKRKITAVPATAVVEKPYEPTPAELFAAYSYMMRNPTYFVAVASSPVQVRTARTFRVRNKEELAVLDWIAEEVRALNLSQWRPEDADFDGEEEVEGEGEEAGLDMGNEKLLQASQADVELENKLAKVTNPILRRKIIQQHQIQQGQKPQSIGSTSAAAKSNWTPSASGTKPGDALGSFLQKVK
ncbi:hypothetical protein HK102_004658, partial [Quaeritorhiza haematococci]